MKIEKFGTVTAYFEGDKPMVEVTGFYFVGPGDNKTAARVAILEAMRMMRDALPVPLRWFIFIPRRLK
jgi:hypothetical protein